MPAFLESVLSPFRRRRVTPTSTIGAPGTALFGGYVDEKEKNRRLVGVEKYRTYSQLLANTAIVAAGTRYFLNLTAKAKWTVEAVDDTPTAIEFKERVEDMMDGMETPWHRVVRRSAMYRFYGFSVQEWTAMRAEDGSLTMRDIAPRPQITIERWDSNENGVIEGMIQRSPQTQEEIYLPRGKTIYLVDDTLNDSPEGLGLFRHIVESVERLRRYEQLEGFGYEMDLAGIPIARAPLAELQEAVEAGEITKDELNLRLQPLKDFISKRIKNPALGMLLDSITYQSEDDESTPSNIKQWDMELLDSGNQSGTLQDAMARAIERLNQEIARVLGVEGLLLGSTNHGSQALSTDKSHNFALIVDSTNQEIAQQYDKDIIDVLWMLNGYPEEYKPRFKTESAQYRDTTQITTALREMALAGSPLTMGDPAINVVRELLGLPDQPEADLQTMLDSALIGRGGGGQQNANRPITEIEQEDETDGSAG